MAKASDGPPPVDRHARFGQARGTQLTFPLRLADPDGDPDEPVQLRSACSAVFWSHLSSLEVPKPPEALDPTDAQEDAFLSKWISRPRGLGHMTSESLQQMAEEAEAKDQRAANRASNAARNR